MNNNKKKQSDGRTTVGPDVLHCNVRNKKSETYKKMSTAWCSANKQEILTGLKKDINFENKDCLNNPIKTHYELAKSIDIQGTPTIISQTGFTIPGYIDAKDLIEYLK